MSSKYCAQCDQHFARPYNRTLHNQKKHQNQISRIICPICVENGDKQPTLCSTMYNLKTHFGGTHKKYKGRIMLKDGKFNGKPLKYTRFLLNQGSTIEDVIFGPHLNLVMMIVLIVLMMAKALMNQPKMDRLQKGHARRLRPSQKVRLINFIFDSIELLNFM